MSDRKLYYPATSETDSLNHKEREEIFIQGMRKWDELEKKGMKPHELTAETMPKNPYTGLRAQIWENGVWFAKAGGNRYFFLD